MYPCECEDMRWLINHHDLFMLTDESHWILKWMELNKEGTSKMQVERLGIKFNYCMFCGKKIKG